MWITLGKKKHFFAKKENVLYSWRMTSVDNELTKLAERDKMAKRAQKLELLTRSLAQQQAEASLAMQLDPTIPRRERHRLQSAS